MSVASERPTTECAYDGRPAVTVRTGRQGNQFGLCADCGPEHVRLLGAERRVEATLARIEKAKQDQPPNVVEFWDALASLIRKSGDPDAVFDWLFDAIERDRATARS